MAKETFTRDVQIKRLVEDSNNDTLLSAQNSVQAGLEQITTSVYQASDALLSVSEVLARLTA